MKRLLLACLVAAVATPALAADVLVRTKTHTDAMSLMGQSTPARDDVNEVWIGGTKMATTTRDGGYIVDLDRNVAVIVNHRDKSYIETPLPVDFSKLLPPEAAAMAGMMSVTATVAPTTETKRIGQWDCTRYDATLAVMGMKMHMQIWATTQVPFDLQLFTSRMMPAVIQGQMRMNAGSVTEFAKIKGFHIATETTGDMMGAKIRSTTEVVEMTAKPAPAGTYDVPAGYTKKATLSMQELQRR